MTELVNLTRFGCKCMREFRGVGGGGKESGPPENHKLYE